MLSKSATMLLGLITHQPLNAYEIVKNFRLHEYQVLVQILERLLYMPQLKL